MATYPTGLSALNNPNGSTSMADPAFLHADQHSQANDEIDAIEAELGTDPSAGHATVKDRLNAMDNNLYAFTPVGVVFPYAGSTAPANFLLCAGQVVSRTTYASLFAVVGTSFNTGGEAATDFRLPDLRGRVPVGMDNMGGTDAGRVSSGNAVGTAGGAESVVLTELHLPSHTHTINHGHGHGIAVTAMSGNTGDDSPDHGHTVPDHAHSAYTYGGNGAHNHGVLATPRSNYQLGNSSAGMYAASYTYNTTDAGAHEHNVGVNGSGNIGSWGATVRHQHSMSHGHSISGGVTDFNGSSGGTGGGTGFSLMQPYLTMTYIIKYI